MLTIRKRWFLWKNNSHYIFQTFSFHVDNTLFGWIYLPILFTTYLLYADKGISNPFQLTFTIINNNLKYVPVILIIHAYLGKISLLVKFSNDNIINLEACLQILYLYTCPAASYDISSTSICRTPLDSPDFTNIVVTISHTGSYVTILLLVVILTIYLFFVPAEAYFLDDSVLSTLDENMTFLLAICNQLWMCLNVNSNRQEQAKLKNGKWFSHETLINSMVCHKEKW